MLRIGTNIAMHDKLHSHIPCVLYECRDDEEDPEEEEAYSDDEDVSWKVIRRVC
jgi:hypothetical protein